MNNDIQTVTIIVFCTSNGHICQFYSFAARKIKDIDVGSWLDQLIVWMNILVIYVLPYIQTKLLKSEAHLELPLVN